MPGHKGKKLFGPESFDITEIDGADCLSHSDGIIEESRKNASQLFGANTFYSTEGSSHAIRAMLLLALKHARKNNLSNVIASGRNAHKSFISACALLDLQVDWIYSDNAQSYLSCSVTAQSIEEFLNTTKTLPFAIYLTSPDYLGNTVDILNIAEVCRKKKVLLLVDNAHGAYLKFLPVSLHPMDLGADMCCDSAHKTLPCLTGGAYLHIRKDFNANIISQTKTALAVMGSTSPSYLTLQSLDRLNAYLYSGYKEKLLNAVKKIATLKEELLAYGYTLIGDEPLKLTINAKAFGVSGSQINEYLKANNVYCEFYDQDFVVFMLSPEFKNKDYNKIKKVLTSIPKRQPILSAPPTPTKKVSALSFKNALLSPSKTVPLSLAEGQILASITVSCPPAVPIVVLGEIIDQNAIETFKYYNLNFCDVVIDDK